jgi:hypothetical protein
MIKRIITDIEPYEEYEPPLNALSYNSVMTENGERIAIYYEDEDEVQE